MSGNALITVNYGLSVEDAVEIGRYDWANNDITSKNFPTTQTGKAEVVLEPIHFNCYISTKDAPLKLDRMGYRPAELHELLAFGEKYQNVQREFPIVALGSVWHQRGGRRVPCLYGDSSGRVLGLLWVGRAWPKISRFAAVCK